MLSLSEYFGHPEMTASILLKHFFTWLPDKIYLTLMFRFNMGYWLNWNNPSTFSEKLQWLKLYDRRPEYTKMVDKLAVKEYVASQIGDEFIIPTIGVWNQPEDIDWDLLPNQFVLKTTHGGGSSGVVICKDKSLFDRDEAIRKLRKSMKQDIYRVLKEWPYKNVPRRILAEKYIADEAGELNDYKVFCFNGIPKFCQVIQGRNSYETVDFFDMNWKHQDFHEPQNIPFADFEPKQPRNFNLMIKLATKISETRSFSRIDFYEVENKVYFGEITFYPTSGFGGFCPKEMDENFGSMIILPYNC